jgi:hypothetical protein
MALLSILLPATAVIFLFLRFLITGKNAFASGLITVCEISCIALGPLMFLLEFDMGQKNDCCTDSAIFAPGHRITVYTIILLCIIAFFIPDPGKR